MQPAQQKFLDIQRGLFLFKYESADDRANPPKVSVSPGPGSRDIDLILAPDADEPVLWSPGACLVVRSERPGRLRVVVEPTVRNGSVAAKVQLVVLAHDPAGVRTRATQELDLSGFRLVGHVAGIGDVFASPEEWIAGPTAPSRIEGIAVQWSEMPEDFVLRYAVRIGGQRPATTESMYAGTYAGTRGRALPLIGATLEISGAAATGYQLVVDAIFLGSPQMRITGQRTVLAGPTGREPLVGLRVGVEAVEKAKTPVLVTARAKAPRPESEPAGRATTPAAPSSPANRRVRVFRNRKAIEQEQDEDVTS